MSTQFPLACHASIVWFKQNNEKLKGKSLVSPPKVMKISWDSMQAWHFSKLLG